MILESIKENLSMHIQFGALGYSALKVELYKGVIATIRVHLSEK